MALPVFIPESMKYNKQAEIFLGKMTNMIGVMPNRYKSTPADLILTDKQKTYLRECYFMDYIRWKYGSDGSILTNAKMVRFKDGSMFVYIG
jgi:hypothetical protein